MDGVHVMRWVDLWQQDDDLVRRPRQVDENVHIARRANVVDHAPVAHDYVAIGLILTGEAVHDSLHDRRRVGKGSAMVIRPGAWHALCACRELNVMVCSFVAKLLDRELAWLVDEQRLRFMLWPAVGDGVVHVTLPESRLDFAIDVLERIAGASGQEAQASRLAELLLLLCTFAPYVDPSQLADFERLSCAPAVAEALRLLSGDIAQQWTLEELAAEVAVSPRHLSRLFRLHVGRSPIAHLSVLRAEAAATRLLQTDESAATVGARVGWEDPNYFARRFRSHFGVSPVEFRRHAAAHPRSTPGA
jgi:AraC family L-rhamnose operon transcriptional activator RhaR